MLHGECRPFVDGQSAEMFPTKGACGSSALSIALKSCKVVACTAECGNFGPIERHQRTFPALSSLGYDPTRLGVNS